MFKYDLTIIIPSLNESDNLKKLIPEIKSEIGKKFTYEIFIIDGINKDNKTFKITKKNSIRYLNRIRNNDYGNAVRLGIKKSTGKYILFMDGDYSHNPKFILKLYENKLYDVVIASRYVPGGKTDNGLLSETLSRFLNKFYNIILNLELEDVSNSFKLYNTKMIKRLHLSCNHFDIIEEIIFKLKKNNDKIKFLEVPYHFKQRKFGKSKRNFFIIIAYLFSILKLRIFK
jgi:dolichol-phosphate mannosyltransferase